MAKVPKCFFRGDLFKLKFTLVLFQLLYKSMPLTKGFGEDLTFVLFQEIVHVIKSDL